MSIASSRIHCSGCDYSYYELYQPITLKCRFGDGVVSYYKELVWCHDCGCFRYAECLPSEDEIRQDYEEYYDVPGRPATRIIDRLKRACDRQYHEFLQELNLKLAWRKARTAKPHCLTCVGTNLEVLHFTKESETTAIAQGFRHSCGGAIIHDFADNPDMRLHFRESVLWYDLEGNQVVEE